MRQTGAEASREQIATPTAGATWFDGIQLASQALCSYPVTERLLLAAHRLRPAAMMNPGACFLQREQGKVVMLAGAVAALLETSGVVSLSPDARRKIQPCLGRCAVVLGAPELSRCFTPEPLKRMRRWPSPSALKAMG